jgi:hypothetical protein
MNKQYKEHMCVHLKGKIVKGNKPVIEGLEVRWEGMIRHYQAVLQFLGLEEDCSDAVECAVRHCGFGITKEEHQEATTECSGVRVLWIREKPITETSTATLVKMPFTMSQVRARWNNDAVLGKVFIVLRGEGLTKELIHVQSHGSRDEVEVRMNPGQKEH